MKNSTLIAGIELYTGRKVATLKRFNDPIVEGAMALRATMDNGFIADFLISAGEDLHTAEDVDRNLEDTMWETWPPKVGTPRFF